MSDASSRGTDPSRHAIYSAVYSASPTSRNRPWLLAALAALMLHASIVAWANLVEPTLESWAATLALDLHNAMGREDVVTLETPPPPPLPTDPPKQVRRERAPAKSAQPKTPMPAAQPAQAAQVIADPSAPADLTANTFVTGTASHYLGGATATSGSNTQTPAVPTADLSWSVHLEATEWSCPWPKEADREQIDRQAVVIKVEVDDRGAVQSAQLIKDAQGGFGAAAVQCAKRTKFEPARDKQGRAIRSWSPPIEVTFQR